MDDLERRRNLPRRRSPVIVSGIAAATAGFIALLAHPITVGDLTVQLRVNAPLLSIVVQDARGANTGERTTRALNSYTLRVGTGDSPDPPGGDTVAFQVNWLAFSDTAPNDSIEGMPIPAPSAADSAALYDFGRWETEFANGARDSLVALKPVGDTGCSTWPTGLGHSARFKITGETPAFMFSTASLTTPPVGEYQYQRHYVCLDAPQGFNPADQHYLHHGDDDGTGNYGSWLELDIDPFTGEPYGVTADSIYRIQLLLNVNEGAATGFPVVWVNIDSVKTHRVYMIETRAEHVSSSEARLAMRLHRVESNGDHTLLKTTTDFRLECQNNGGTACDDVVGNDWSTLPIDRPSSYFNVIQTGYNGSQPDPLYGNRFVLTSGYAVKNSSAADDWIGPFCTPSNECN